MNDHKLAATKWTQAQYDYALKQLWAELTDIPMNPDTERMEAQFLHFPAGTEREDIWHWFDERYSKGIVKYSVLNDAQQILLHAIVSHCPLLKNCSRRLKLNAEGSRMRRAEDGFYKYKINY